jgi:site-specific DNA-methyltransferase (adenine-specific)
VEILQAGIGQVFRPGETMNLLYYGDNLDILKKHIKDESIDLIYLDPPFQSGKNYNQIFQPQAGGIKGETAQRQAFEDTWTWGEEAELEYTGLITGTLTKEPPSQKLIDLMKAMWGYLGECPLLAYLCMMSPRLLEMRRVLRPTGSIYLHCDPTASHYLKLLMDAVFGTGNFRNEIVWCYKGPTRVKADFPRKHDIILRYSKGSNPYFNSKNIKIPYSESFLKRREQAEGKGGIFKGGQKKQEEELKKYQEGKLPEDWWNDIPSGGQISRKELVGYPTQKPEALLERIIKASSNEGDTVLDPFCGCGTTVAVAEKTNRKWIGVDITYLAIDVIKKRIAKENEKRVEKDKIKENIHFKIDGIPTSVYSAGRLAEQKPFDFEIWAVSKLNGTPTTKTGDKGIDGVINFIDPTKKDKIGKGIISVKGGHSINPGMVRDLKGTIQSQNADFGILITAENPTRGMIEEAVKEGSFNFCYHEGTVSMKIPKIQLLTIEDLFTDPIPVKLPSTVMEPYRKPDMKKKAEEEAGIF